MSLIGTKIPNYAFLVRFKLRYRAHEPKKLKLNIHLTKSPKPDHIYKSCL